MILKVPARYFSFFWFVRPWRLQRREVVKFYQPLLGVATTLDLRFRNRFQSDDSIHEVPLIAPLTIPWQSKTHTTTGLIQATYVTGEKEGAIKITIYSIYGSFYQRRGLGSVGWTDLDQDGFIDQFIVEPVLPGMQGVAGFVLVLPPCFSGCASRLANPWVDCLEKNEKRKSNDVAVLPANGFIARHDFHQGGKLGLRAQEDIRRDIRDHRTKGPHCVGRVEWFGQNDHASYAHGGGESG